MSPEHAVHQQTLRNDLLAFAWWAGTWAGLDELAEGRAEEIVDRYLKERP